MMLKNDLVRTLNSVFLATTVRKMLTSQLCVLALLMVGLLHICV